ncbi:MAG: DUF58 domain-containing protein, partial [Verrucomicrobiota bacterium]
GNLPFQPAHLLRWSPFGLWHSVSHVGESQTTSVYPNYEPVIRYSLLALANRQDSMGIVHRNRQGMSKEFHQLRDYTPGDVLSQVDWKATSRRLELVSREYREERDQTLIALIDSGRRMRAIDGELPQFDHCLNAVLLMSFIALKQGDQVGALSFGGTDHWLPPVKGSHAMPGILNHLYDYQTTRQPSDFAEAAERLTLYQKRRAMVVILTNLRAEDANDLVPAVRLLQKTHLVMVASLRERSVRETMASRVEDLEGALRYGATSLYLEERRDLFEQMRRKGVLTVDEEPNLLPVALTNAYLDAKYSGRI